MKLRWLFVFLSSVVFVAATAMLPAQDLPAVRTEGSVQLVAQIAGVEQAARANGQWVTEHVLNGDQTDQGRALQMDAHQIRIYRVKLVTYLRH